MESGLGNEIGKQQESHQPQSGHTDAPARLHNILSTHIAGLRGFFLEAVLMAGDMHQVT